jgi:hypothetical protein
MEAFFIFHYQKLSIFTAKNPAMKFTNPHYNRLVLIRKTALLFVVLLAAKTNAQSTLLWSDNHTVDMPDYYTDSPAITYDANTATLVVTGRKNTQNGQRLSVVNYSLDGNVQSEQALGSDLLTNNTIVDYKIDSEQNIYILHSQTMNVNLYKTVLQKYSAEGTLIWAKKIQDAVYSYTPIGMTLNNSGSGIFVTLTREIWDFDFSYDISKQLYIFDTDGNITSQKTFDDTTELQWISPRILSSGSSVYVFGKDLTSGMNFKALKIDEDNNIVTNAVITQSAIPNQIELTPDGNMLLTTNSNVSKITPLGELIWSGPALDVAYYEVSKVIQDQDGTIYVTGRKWGGQPDTNNDILTTKYDSTGSIAWQIIYQYGGQNADIGSTLVLKNGSVYVGGYSQREGISTDYDYVLLKIDDEDGSLTGAYRYNGDENGDEQLSSIYVFDNDNVAITGLSYVNSGYNQTTQLLAGVPLKAYEVSYAQNMTVWPNPAESGTLITVSGIDLLHYKILSLSGQIIMEDNLEASGVYSINTDGLSSGLYLLSVESENGEQVKKILIQ